MYIGEGGKITSNVTNGARMVKGRKDGCTSRNVHTNLICHSREIFFPATLFRAISTFNCPAPMHKSEQGDGKGLPNFIKNLLLNSWAFLHIEGA